MFCTLYRYLISRCGDEDRPLGNALRRHVEACPRCRRFARATEQMRLRLAADARPARHTLPPPLQARLERAAAGPAAPTVVRLPLRRVGYLAAAAILVLACGFAAYFALSRGPEGAPPEVSRKEPVAPEVTPVETAGELFDAGAVLAAETLADPYGDDLRELRRRGQAAAEFILACATLHVDLEGPADAPPPGGRPRG